MQNIERRAPIAVREADSLMATCYRLAAFMAENGFKHEESVDLSRIDVFRVTNRFRSDYVRAVLEDLVDAEVIEEPDDLEAGGCSIQLTELGQEMFAN